MLHLLSVIIIASMISPALSQSTRKATPSYPSWFWEMPSDGHVTFAVGYSRRYFQIDTSFAYARRNSVWQLVRSHQVMVDAGQELFNRSGQNRLLKLTESEQIDSTWATTVVAGISIIDSAVVGDIVLALAAYPKSTVTRDWSIRSLPPNKPPWVDKVPEESSFIYAVGTSMLYYYEHHSWEHAEANARRQLASILATHIRSVSQYDKQTMQTWSQSHSSVVLQNVIVVKRWLDMAGRQCFVLCRMPLQ